MCMVEAKICTVYQIVCIIMVVETSMTIEEVYSNFQNSASGEM